MLSNFLYLQIEMHKCKRCNLEKIPENSILAICPDCKARQDKADRERKEKIKENESKGIEDFLLWFRKK